MSRQRQFLLQNSLKSKFEHINECILKSALHPLLFTNCHQNNWQTKIRKVEIVENPTLNNQRAIIRTYHATLSVGWKRSESSRQLKKCLEFFLDVLFSYHWCYTVVHHAFEAQPIMQKWQLKVVNEANLLVGIVHLRLWFSPSVHQPLCIVVCHWAHALRHSRDTKCNIHANHCRSWKLLKSMSWSLLSPPPKTTTWRLLWADLTTNFVWDKKLYQDKVLFGIRASWPHLLLGLALICFHCA